MKKFFLIILLSLFVFTGCNNKGEDEKNEYLAMKSDLLEQQEYTSADELVCDILVNIDREDPEKIVYTVTLSNPKENMNSIKAIVVHNYYTEELFPTIGLFDDEASLIIGEENDAEIDLSGTIDTTDDIDTIDLELKVLIEYTDDNNEVKDIYYKST